MDEVAREIERDRRRAEGLEGFVQGMRYQVLEPGGGTGPILMAVEPKPGEKWTAEAEAIMVGQTFWLRLRGRMLSLTVIAARVNPMTRNMELTCR